MKHIHYAVSSKISMLFQKDQRVYQALYWRNMYVISKTHKSNTCKTQGACILVLMAIINQTILASELRAIPIESPETLHGWEPAFTAINIYPKWGSLLLAQKTELELSAESNHRSHTISAWMAIYWQVMTNAKRVSVLIFPSSLFGMESWTVSSHYPALSGSHFIYL